jgi:hypothetical protein
VSWSKEKEGKRNFWNFATRELTKGKRGEKEQWPPFDKTEQKRYFAKIGNFSLFWKYPCPAGEWQKSRWLILGVTIIPCRSPNYVNQENICCSIFGKSKKEIYPKREKRKKGKNAVAGPLFAVLLNL